MRRAWLAAGAAGVGMIALMLWLLAMRTPPPPIPLDAAHAGIAAEPGCLACHGVGGPAPRTKRHPLSNRCFQCHEAGPS